MGMEALSPCIRPIQIAYNKAVVKLRGNLQVIKSKTLRKAFFVKLRRFLFQNHQRKVFVVFALA